jgi:protein involved in polysaccharide export with SLBB domain
VNFENFIPIFVRRQRRFSGSAIPFGRIRLRRSKNGVGLGLYLTLLLSICFVGCNGHAQLPSKEQLAEFERAGPSGPAINGESPAKAKIIGGPYRVAPGEVLELTMPAILGVVTAEDPRTTERTTPYICRVSEIGTISLPVVGEIQVAGKSLAEIEATIIYAYYPRYTMTRPSVFVRLLQMPLFTVIGLVEKPGNFPYPPDVQYNLMQALAFAGGVDKNLEPRYVSIYRLRHDGEIANVTLKFTERSRLTSAANTIIKPGDIIDVAHTPTTRTKAFLRRIIYIHIGAYIPLFR